LVAKQEFAVVENSTARKKDYRSDGKFGNPKRKFPGKFFFRMKIISTERLIHTLYHPIFMRAQCLPPDSFILEDWI
jgi:hypothetical protein